MDDARPSPNRRPMPDGLPADGGRDGTTRRWFLAGGAAVVLGAAGGTAVGFTRDDAAHPTPNPPPPALAAAAERERRLIADLDATTGGLPALRLVLVGARADHAEHLMTFEQLLRSYDPLPSPSPSPSGSGSPVAGVPRTAAQLRAAEQSAATAAARAAGGATGRLAVLLASVSACESSHAALIG